jgi:hypothetical protein
MMQMENSGYPRPLHEYNCTAHVIKWLLLKHVRIEKIEIPPLIGGDSRCKSIQDPSDLVVVQASRT